MSPLCSNNAWKKYRKLPSTCGGASPELGMSSMKGGCSMCAPTMRRSLSSASSPGPCTMLWWPEKLPASENAAPRADFVYKSTSCEERQLLVRIQHMPRINGVT